MGLISKLRMGFNRPFHDNLNFTRLQILRVFGFIYYKRVFGHFGNNSVLYKPLLLVNPRYVYVGNDVVIGPGARIEGAPVDGERAPEFRIGNNVNIEQSIHIGFAGKLLIHDNVTIASRCSILAATHPFFDIHSPLKIGARLGGANSFTEIGEGSYIGADCIILINVKIGKYVVVGANSVVRKNVPDYTVVEGNPAVPILRYDKEQDRWVPIAKH